MKGNLIKLIFSIIYVCIYISGCGSEPKVIIEGEISAESTEWQTGSTDIQQTDIVNEVYVYVTGKVKNPDVYKVPEDYRIYQVIELAGGFLEDAETRNINLADRISDGMQITVYAVGEETVQVYGQSTETGSSLININTASKRRFWRIF